MNIQKYLGHDGQPTHDAFSVSVIADDFKQWAPRLEAAITASRIRLAADVEIVAGRTTTSYAMVRIYLFFDKKDSFSQLAVIHLTSFCNMLGKHGFSASAGETNLNFINS